MKKYNFVHIPKTGGSTFRMNVLNNESKILISMNHETKYDKDSRNITFIRNPIDRTISHYNEIKNNTINYLPFEKWFGEKYHDYQTKWLLDKVLGTSELNTENFEKLKKILKEFYFIGLTENIDKFLKKLLNSIDLIKCYPNTNVANKRYYQSIKEEKLILSKNKFDKELYDFVKEFK